jgi:hypothetical protein
MRNTKTRAKPVELRKPTEIQQIIDNGLLFQANRMVFMPFGFVLAYKVVDGKPILFVKDMRGKPEEARFYKEVLEAGAEKYERFSLEEGFGLMNRRRKKLGYAVQDWTRKTSK